MSMTIRERGPGLRPPVASRWAACCGKRIVLAVGLVVLLLLVYVALLVQPSHHRDWEFGVDLLPQITLQGGSVAVRNVRDFRYTAADAFGRLYRPSVCGGPHRARLVHRGAVYDSTVRWIRGRRAHVLCVRLHRPGAAGHLGRGAPRAWRDIRRGARHAQYVRADLYLGYRAGSHWPDAP